MFRRRCWPGGSPQWPGMLDPLTKLCNRRGLQNRLADVTGAGRMNTTILLLDIDHFKACNDHYGHMMMGDQALIRVSAAIRRRRAIAR